MTASDRQMAVQLLRGDGVGQNITGIVNTTGSLLTTYATTDAGAQAGYHTAEDAVGEDVPADRRVWVLAEGLFRVSRRTLRDPGSGHFVVRRLDGTARVLDDSPAIRTNTLESGYAVYGEWTAGVLGLWSDMLVTIDRISVPGTLRITLDRYFDFAVSRPARFSVLKEA